MADPPAADPFPEARRDTDAGAVFVLESKGEWWHAGYHLTTAIVGPTILTLPYAFRGLGWALGFLCLTVMGAVTFYSYFLLSKGPQGPGLYLRGSQPFSPWILAGPVIRYISLQ
ncbi:hypothetical protein CRG98_044179 [Punica granatum]|uniref:Amino acid transporter transmembrane domain-containing protein n=1 Tax=Punica granatum TaxID=22663 RepID=A0A2I0HVY1_PUNGR|nr:hypothetical protein CRG98_044179 [Punica granatum]